MKSEKREPGEIVKVGEWGLISRSGCRSGRSGPATIEATTRFSRGRKESVRTSSCDGGGGDDDDDGGGGGGSGDGGNDRGSGKGASGGAFT
ncbi:hypothetical protein PV327_006018 [Microctonus hyperodae]|uniref:Uncharacterized protein n=1 Tax=Microctonus hyperodae TaxID=165561 RepID=A0AA39G2L2_MICHY|nr:hypothetical protein PV327_006018 [Microctonus hyperodae]